MNKDTILSANTSAVNGTFDYLRFAGEHISDSIHPLLVKRANLHPTENEGVVEDRIYYTLHNDAGSTIYKSKFIKVEETLGESTLKDPTIGDEPLTEIYPTGPRIPIGPPEPIDPNDPFKPLPVPPPPPPIPGPIPDPDDIIIDDDDPPGDNPPDGEEDEEEGGGFGGGGGGTTGDDDDDPEDSPEWSPVSNFNCYSAVAANMGDDVKPQYIADFPDGYQSEPWCELGTLEMKQIPKRVKTSTKANETLDDVYDRMDKMTRIYTNTNILNTAFRAMFGTSQTNVNFNLPKLTDGTEMYRYSSCQSVNSTSSSVTKAPGMFALCGCLDTVTLNMPRLKNADNLCLEDDVLRTADLSKTNLSTAISAFQNCKSLTKAKIPSKNLTKIDYIFDGCTELNNSGIIFSSTTLPKLTHANFAFRNTKIGSFTNLKLPALTEAKGLAINCSKLKTVNIDLPAATILQAAFANCPVLKDFTLTARSVTNITNIITGSPALVNVDMNFYSATVDVTGLINGLPKLETLTLQAKEATGTWPVTHCDNLKKVDINVGTIAPNNAFEGHSNLEDATILTVSTDTTNLFKNCSKLKTLWCKITADGWTSGANSTNSDGGLVPGCTSLRDLTFSCSNAYKIGDTFSSLPSLTNVNINVSANDCSYLFYNDSNLTKITGSITTANADGLFYRCSLLKNVNGLSIGSNSSSGYSGQYMFYDSGLTEAPGGAIGAYNAKGMFAGCKDLKIANLNVPNALTVDGMYDGCPIEKVTAANFSQLKSGRGVLNSSKLDKDSARLILGALMAAPTMGGEEDKPANEPPGDDNNGMTIGLREYWSEDEIEGLGLVKSTQGSLVWYNQSNKWIVYFI